MKKFALLAGVAVLSAIGVSAHADDIHNGQYISGSYQPWNPNSVWNLNGSQNANHSVSAWHAIGGSAGDVGTAIGNDGATFTLKGKVNTDCAFYSGSSQAHTLDFGTLGIYATDNVGPALALDMVGPGTVSVQIAAL